MTRSQSIRRLTKNSALYLGLAMAVIVAIPALAALVYGIRLVIPLVIVAGLLGALASPAVRRWFASDVATQRHGLPAPPASLIVHRSHAWASPEPQGRARVGIDALMAAALGRVTAIEAVPVGARVEPGQPVCTLFHGERRLQVLAPVSGEVACVNAQSGSDPSQITRSPYAGWVVELKNVEAKPESTVTGPAIAAWFGREVDRFVAALGSPAAATMADGGVLHSDLSAAIDEARWTEISKSFFA